jgi:menaquinone-specific isochorismate synthase
MQTTLSASPPLETQSDDLRRWVKESIQEALSKRSTRSVRVVEMELSFKEIPYWVFDSTTVPDLHFFTKTDGYFLGLGVAKKWQLSSEASADEIRSVQTFLTEGVENEKVWLFGGWSFPEPTNGNRGKSGGRDPNWRNFPPSEWTIPALTLVSEKGRARLILAINVEADQKTKVSENYESLLKTLLDSPVEGGRDKPPHKILSKNVPSQKAWISLVQSALDAISNGDYQKVVLARSLELLYDSEIPVSVVLRNLVESRGSATVFAIKKGDQTFTGATPENLFSMRKGKLEVDCLASSAPRSQNGKVDDSLGRNLLNDPKSRYEQKLVVEQITRSLSAMSDEIHVSGEPVLKKLPHVQHLHSTVRAKLRPEVTLWSAAQSLWPTPATCGEPKKVALRWICNFEGISRGWYSGIVGCVNAKGDCADLYVAIRSGLIRGNSAFLFAGSGIVPGSDPQKEFDETNWKMKTMMNALTGR